MVYLVYWGQTMPVLLEEPSPSPMLVQLGTYIIISYRREKMLYSSLLFILATQH